MTKEIIDKQKRKELIVHHLISGGITLLIGSIIFIIYFFMMGHRFVDAVNGMALTTVVLFSMAILSLLARLGAFDTFAYGFMQLGSSLFSHNPKKYASMPEYKQAKYDARKTKKKTYLSMLMATVIFLLALIVLEIIYHTKIGQ